MFSALVVSGLRVMLLPSALQVKVHNLRYDLYDAKLFVTKKLGCPVPPELQSSSGKWICNAVSCLSLGVRDGLEIHQKIADSSPPPMTGS